MTRDLDQTNRHATKRRQQRAATDRAVAEMHRRAQRRQEEQDEFVDSALAGFVLGNVVLVLVTLVVVAEVLRSW